MLLDPEHSGSKITHVDSVASSVLSRKYVHIAAGLWQRLNLRYGPDKRMWVTVLVLWALIDFLDQFLHTAKRSPANGLLGDGG